MRRPPSPSGLPAPPFGPAMKPSSDMPTSTNTVPIAPSSRPKQADAPCPTAGASLFFLQISVRATPPRALQIAALLLLDLERHEQRLEVADAEAAAAVPFDPLEKPGRAVLHRRGEDL